MKKSNQFMLFAIVMLIVSLYGCSPVSTPPPATFTPTPIPPTFTPEPTGTATQIPSPTPFWYTVVPAFTPSNEIPWYPSDESTRTVTYFFFFNLSLSPFDNVLVRQAFTAATDRELLAKTAKDTGITNPRPATTFTPPEALGKDLYNNVGIPFNPALAKELLSQAGYSDPDDFPVINLLALSGADTHVSIINELAKMWQEHLNVKVTVEIVDNRRELNTRSRYMGLGGWGSDANDPDYFLRQVFRSDVRFGFSQLSNSEFDKLVDLALKNSNPIERQELYIQAERILCETEAAIIPMYHYTYNPE